MNDLTDDIEKSNFNPQMLKACTDTSYQCGYEQGKAEAIKEYKQSDEYIKECVQRYLKGKADGKVEAITDFAKWEDDNNINYYEFDNCEDVVKRYLAWKMKEDKQ